MCTECLHTVKGLSAVTNDKLTLCVLQAHIKREVRESQIIIYAHKVAVHKLLDIDL